MTQRIKWLSAGELQDICEKLVRAGMIEAVVTGRTTRFRCPDAPINRVSTSMPATAVISGTQFPHWKYKLNVVRPAPARAVNRMPQWLARVKVAAIEQHLARLVTLGKAAPEAEKFRYRAMYVKKAAQLVQARAALAAVGQKAEVKA
jgi:hypothetical protein